LDNVRIVMEAGIKRVAVSGAITAADDPGHAAREIKEHLRQKNE